MPTDTPSPLAAAAEALLKHYEGDEPHPDERRYDRWLRQLNARLEELGVALASDAAWRARAEAAVEVAEAIWAVDVAWMAYEPSDDPNAGPNASQRRHTAAVERLRAARRRYEEAARG